jgi:hypothetical protein
VRPADSECRRIYSEINTGDWWWDTQDQLSPGTTIVPVILASDKTHLINISGDKHAWPLYFTVGNIQNNFRCAPTKHTSMFVALIPSLPNGDKDTEEAWHSAVGTVLSPRRNLDITGPGLKHDCAEGLFTQCYLLLAFWVRDYPEQVLVTQVS